MKLSVGVLALRIAVPKHQHEHNKDEVAGWSLRLVQHEESRQTSARLLVRRSAPTFVTLVRSVLAGGGCITHAMITMRASPSLSCTTDELASAGIFVACLLCEPSVLATRCSTITAAAPNPLAPFPSSSRRRCAWAGSPNVRQSPVAVILRPGGRVQPSCSTLWALFEEQDQEQHDNEPCDKHRVDILRRR